MLERTGADPHALKRLGRKRLTALLIRASRGAWRESHAEAILAAAATTQQLWAAGGLDLAELAEDLAGEARLALHLMGEITGLDDRTWTIGSVCSMARLTRLASSSPGPV